MKRYDARICDNKENIYKVTIPRERGIDARTNKQAARIAVNSFFRKKIKKLRFLTAVEGRGVGAFRCEIPDDNGGAARIIKVIVRRKRVEAIKN